MPPYHPNSFVCVPMAPVRHAYVLVTDYLCCDINLIDRDHLKFYMNIFLQLMSAWNKSYAITVT